MESFSFDLDFLDGINLQLEDQLEVQESNPNYEETGIYNIDSAEQNNSVSIKDLASKLTQHNDMVREIERLSIENERLRKLSVSLNQSAESVKVLYQNEHKILEEVKNKNEKIRKEINAYKMQYEDLVKSTEHSKYIHQQVTAKLEEKIVNLDKLIKMFITYSFCATQQLTESEMLTAGKRKEFRNLKTELLKYNYEVPDIKLSVKHKSPKSKPIKSTKSLTEMELEENIDQDRNNLSNSNENFGFSPPFKLNYSTPLIQTKVDKSTQYVSSSVTRAINTESKIKRDIGVNVPENFELETNFSYKVNNNDNSSKVESIEETSNDTKCNQNLNIIEKEDPIMTLWKLFGNKFFEAIRKRNSTLLELLNSQAVLMSQILTNEKEKDEKPTYFYSDKTDTISHILDFSENQPSGSCSDFSLIKPETFFENVQLRSEKCNNKSKSLAKNEIDKTVLILPSKKAEDISKSITFSEANTNLNKIPKNPNSLISNQSVELNNDNNFKPQNNVNSKNTTIPNQIVEPNQSTSEFEAKRKIVPLNSFYSLSDTSDDEQSFNNIVGNKEESLLVSAKTENSCKNDDFNNSVFENTKFSCTQYSKAKIQNKYTKCVSVSKLKENEVLNAIEKIAETANSPSKTKILLDNESSKLENNVSNTSNAELNDVDNDKLDKSEFSSSENMETNFKSIFSPPIEKTAIDLSTVMKNNNAKSSYEYDNSKTIFCNKNNAEDVVNLNMAVMEKSESPKTSPNKQENIVNFKSEHERENFEETKGKTFLNSIFSDTSGSSLDSEQSSSSDSESSSSESSDDSHSEKSFCEVLVDNLHDSLFPELQNKKETDNRNSKNIESLFNDLFGDNLDNSPKQCLSPLFSEKDVEQFEETSQNNSNNLQDDLYLSSSSDESSCDNNLNDFKNNKETKLIETENTQEVLESSERKNSESSTKNDGNAECRKEESNYSQNIVESENKTFKITKFELNSKELPPKLPSALMEADVDFQNCLLTSVETPNSSVAKRDEFDSSIKTAEEAISNELLEIVHEKETLNLFITNEKKINAIVESKNEKYLNEPNKIKSCKTNMLSLKNVEVTAKENSSLNNNLGNNTLAIDIQSKINNSSKLKIQHIRTLDFKVNSSIRNLRTILRKRSCTKKNMTKVSKTEKCDNKIIQNQTITSAIEPKIDESVNAVDEILKLFPKINRVRKKAITNRSKSSEILIPQNIKIPESQCFIAKEPIDSGSVKKMEFDQNKHSNILNINFSEKISPKKTESPLKARKRKVFEDNSEYKTKLRKKSIERISSNTKSNCNETLTVNQMKEKCDFSSNVLNKIDCKSSAAFNTNVPENPNQYRSKIKFLETINDSHLEPTSYNVKLKGNNEKLIKTSEITLHNSVSLTPSNKNKVCYFTKEHLIDDCLQNYSEVYNSNEENTEKNSDALTVQKLEIPQSTKNISEFLHSHENVEATTSRSIIETSLCITKQKNEISTSIESIKNGITSENIQSVTSFNDICLINSAGSNLNQFIFDENYSPASPIWKLEESANFNPIEIPLERENCPNVANKNPSIHHNRNTTLIDSFLNQFDCQQQTKIFTKTCQNKNKIQIELIAKLKDILTHYINGPANTEQVKKCIYRLLKNTQNSKIICRAITEVIEVLKDKTKLKTSQLALNISETESKIIVLIDKFNSHIKHFKQNVIAEIHNKIFTLKCQKLQLENLINLVKFNISLMDLQNCNSNKIQNQIPEDDRQMARLLIFKCFYYYHIKAIPMVFQLLVSYPSILPRKNDPFYNDDNPIIKTIQSILNSTAFCMSKLDLRHHETFYLLKDFYNYERVKPSREDVIEFLLKKIRQNSLNDISYSFALICKQHGTEWTERFVIEKYILPLINEYYIKILETNENDKRIECLLETLSFILKPFPINLNNFEKYLQIFSNHLHSTTRKTIQQAAVCGILRTSRFGLVNTFTLISNWQPQFEVDRTVKLMIQSFLYKKPLHYWKKLQNQITE